MSHEGTLVRSLFGTYLIHRLSLSCYCTLSPYPHTCSAFTYLNTSCTHLDCMQAYSTLFFFHSNISITPSLYSYSQLYLFLPQKLKKKKMVQCWCGKTAVIRTSWINRNPGCRFYGCCDFIDG